MGYFSAVRKEKILPIGMTWMDLKGIMLSEMSDKSSQILYVLKYMWNLKKPNP